MLRILRPAIAAGLGLVILSGPALSAPPRHTPEGQKAHDALYAAEGFGGIRLAADSEPFVIGLRVGGAPDWRNLSYPTARAVSRIDLADGGVLEVVPVVEGGLVTVRAILWAADDRVFKAQALLPFGGEAGLIFGNGQNVSLRIEQADGAGNAEQLAAALAGPIAPDIQALMGTITKLAPNGSAISTVLPRLTPQQVAQYWAQAGSAPPADSMAALAPAYMQFLKDTPFRNNPGGLQSHIPDGLVVDTFASIALSTGGGKVFDNTATRGGSTTRIGPERIQRALYSSYTRYDLDDPRASYVTINKVIVVDDQAILVRGMRAQLGKMTTVKLAGGHIMSVMPVVRGMNDPDFHGLPVMPQ